MILHHIIVQKKLAKQVVHWWQSHQLKTLVRSTRVVQKKAKLFFQELAKQVVQKKAKLFFQEHEVSCSFNNAEDNKIIKTDDNNFLFDITNNLLTFYDNPY